MNISKNIEWIINSSDWKLVTNKCYQARIQKANPDKIYNVAGQPGVVYNFLEDAYEKINSNENGYIVTGIAGEMWPIPKKAALQKYDITENAITDEPQPVMTKETGTVFTSVQIPANEEFTLEVDYGQKSVLKGNRPGIDHGSGDYVLIATKYINGIYVPDFEDSGRIVNGSIFNILYKPL